MYCVGYTTERKPTFQGPQFLQRVRAQYETAPLRAPQEEPAALQAVRQAGVEKTRTVAANEPFLGELAAEFRRAIQSLAATSAYSYVKFVERVDPPFDPDVDDYRIAYECEFEPYDLEHAYLNLAVAESGRVGIGFETRKRLSRRVGKRLWIAKFAYAAGTELADLSVCELESFIRLVARGGVLLQLGSSVLALGPIAAVVRPEDFDGLNVKNHRSWNWLRKLDSSRSVESQQSLVSYKPW